MVGLAQHVATQARNTTAAFMILAQRVAEIRDECRRRKQFDVADQLRAAVEAAGLKIEDSCGIGTPIPSRVRAGAQ